MLTYPDSPQYLALYKRDRTMYFYIFLIFRFVDMRGEDKSFWIDYHHALLVYHWSFTI